MEAEMLKLCGILPSSLQPQCQTLIQQNGLYIIYFLEQELTPEQVCDALKVCAEKTGITKRLLVYNA